METMAELGALEAMADGLRGPWPRSPQPGPYSRNPFYPQKKFPWGSQGVSGYQEPSGARHTEHDKTRLQGQTNRTGHPTGTRSPPGLAWKLRLPLGMTKSQGPSQGPSATASISATRGQVARMASMATTRGAACLRRVSTDKTRLVKMFLWAQPDIHTALLAMLWTGSTGLGIAAAGGH